MFMQNRTPNQTAMYFGSSVPMKPISSIGEAFDPNLHEALTQVPSADHDPMTVMQVVEPGYQIHDRVIRPAKVIVSCAPPEPAAADEPAAENEDSAEGDV